MKGGSGDDASYYNVPSSVPMNQPLPKTSGFPSGALPAHHVLGQPSAVFGGRLDDTVIFGSGNDSRAQFYLPTEANGNPPPHRLTGGGSSRNGKGKRRTNQVGRSGRGGTTKTSADAGSFRSLLNP